MAPCVEAVVRGRTLCACARGALPSLLLYAGPSSSSRHGFARAFFALQTVSHYDSVVKPETRLIMKSVSCALNCLHFGVTQSSCLNHYCEAPHSLSHTHTHTHSHNHYERIIDSTTLFGTQSKQSVLQPKRPASGALTSRAFLR